MIFYLAVDATGRTLIKGTQADAREANRDFTQIDIPTDKAGLMAWVQQMLDETLNAQPAETGSVAAPASAKPGEALIEETLYELIGSGGGDGETIKDFASRIHSFYANQLEAAQEVKGAAPAPMPVPLSKILTVEYIQNWLIEDAEQRDIERIYTAIGCRVGEIIRSGRE